MARRVLPVGLPLVLAAAGCFPTEQPNNQLVQPSPFGNTTGVATAKPPAAPPATAEASSRVKAVGDKIIAANRALGLMPTFATIGAPQAEVFHTGTKAIWITEGFVKQCPTDRLLAAVLCLELGKMVSEREALVASTRWADEEPPIQMPVGNDSGGVFGSADGTALAERAKYEQNRRRPNQPPPPPPDPQVLAGIYLGKAGYHATDLDDVLPLVKAAQANFTWEKQFTTGPTPPVQVVPPPH
jgi:hypothetical protein